MANCATIKCRNQYKFPNRKTGMWIWCRRTWQNPTKSDFERKLFILEQLAPGKICGDAAYDAHGIDLRLAQPASVSMVWYKLSGDSPYLQVQSRVGATKLDDRF